MRLLARCGFAFDGRINGGIGTDFVIPAISPSLQREVGQIYLLDPASTHHNLAKNIIAHRHQGAVEKIIFSTPQLRQIEPTGFDRNLLLKPAECGFTDANAIYVVGQNKVIHVLRGLYIADRLKRINVERALHALDRGPNALLAGREAVTLIPPISDPDGVL